MVNFTHSELRKLMRLCTIRSNDACEVMNDDESSPLEKHCAKMEFEYMQHLCAKLDLILETNAKRVEIIGG